MFIKLKKCISKKVVSAAMAALAFLFILLNWFARLPYDSQQVIYNRLNDYGSYKLYYFSNAAASVTDSLGITGHDSVAEFKSAVPEVDLVVGGYPHPMVEKALPQKLQYLKRTGFTVCYSPELRHPVWVAVKIPDGRRLPETSRPPFRSDPDAENSPKPNDYAKSGYDRGHMAPNRAIATCYGDLAQKQTFLLSNICPQSPGLNRGPWRKIEHTITDIWPDKYGAISVITGAYSPSPNKKLPSGIDIPEGFYKIIISKKNDQLRVLAVYMNQESGYGVFPRTRIISVDELEQLTGLDFLSALPDDIENKLEAEKPTRLWPPGLKNSLKMLFEHFREPY